MKGQAAKYQQLVEDIRKRIEEGVYRPGDKLESENQLVRRYGYSRQTVRQALGVLENEGLIDRRRGSGTYISQAKKQRERTYNIGVVATYLSDYIFPLIIGGIEEVLTPKGYHITLGVTKNKVDEENRVLRSFMDRKLDGIIIEGTKSAFPNPNLELYRKLQESEIPVVFFNGYYPDLEHTVYVVTDDRKAGFDLTRHLWECGCRKIGGFFKSDDMQGHRRYSGYTKALAESGCEINDDMVLWYTTSDEERFGEEDFDRYIYRHYKDCDGIVCYNDKAAALLAAALSLRGVKVPDDMMLGSFDNSRISELSAVKLTSMNHPKEELGRTAAKTLLRIIETGKLQPCVSMPMDLVVKESTRKKKGT